MSHAIAASTAIPSRAGTTPVHSRKALWGGRIASALAVLFLAFDCVGKLLTIAPVVAGTTQLGYPVSVVRGLGLVELVCLVAYLVPRTSILGAILWTGYLGGAVATHVRIGSPLFSHLLFPIYIGLLLWGGLYLRDRTLRTLIPLRRG